MVPAFLVGCLCSVLTSANNALHEPQTTSRSGKIGGGAISATGDLLAAGLEHHKAGRLDEAERLYHQILSADARHADCRHLLGVLARQRGHLERAVEMFNKAIAIKPDYPEALYNLGLAYQDQGQLAEGRATSGRWP
jgi:tetratricopeptide (TPR) repeat protein